MPAIKSRNPIRKICPKCRSLCINKRSRGGYINKKSKIHGKPKMRIYIGKYICTNCGNRFEEPIIINIRLV